MSNKVKIPKSHQNEWKSQREFEDLVNPWTIVGSWNSKDYGIDGVFSINDELEETSDATPSGLNFMVQLKASETILVKNEVIKFPLEVKKVHQWYQNNLPVLLAVYDLNQNIFYYDWIDQDLINKLNKKKADWTTKDKVTIEIPEANCFKEGFRKQIKTYVKTIYPAQLNRSKPGIYFDLKDKIKALTNKFQVTVNKFQFESPNGKAKQIQEDLEASIYRVAIAGPSRVGKSSLINGLVVRKEVSPTGIYQTTGVPIQIVAGKLEQIEVYFQHEAKEVFSYNALTVRKYASQDKDCNPKNKERVTLVSIHLLNKQLDKGVCYYDLPGLDDPDDLVVRYSRDTLKNANAVIYVIDGSSAANGGYSFRAEYKRDLENFAKENQKLFLVFNKINSLSQTAKKSLKTRVVEDLVEHNLYDKVNERVYFVSAEDGLAKRIKGGEDDAFGEFESDLWRFIISNNKYGIYKLNDVLKKLYEAINDFDGILNTRKMKAAESNKLSIELRTLQSKVPKLQQMYNAEMANLYRSIETKLYLKSQEGLSKLRSRLNSWPKQSNLPSGAFVRDFIINNATQAIEETNEELQIGAKRIKDILDNWIMDNMKKIREITDGEAHHQSIDFSELENISYPDIDLSQSLGIGLASSVLMFLFNPSWAIATFFLTAFGSWILSAESRRAEQINQIMNKAKYNYDSLNKKCLEQYIEALDMYSNRMSKSVNTQLQSHIRDLEKQIKDFGKPLSAVEEILYQKTLNDLNKYRSEIEDLKEEVQVYYYQQ